MERDCVCSESEHATGECKVLEEGFHLSLSTVLSQEDVGFSSFQNTHSLNENEVEDDEIEPIEGIEVASANSKPVAIADDVLPAHQSNSSSTLGGIVQGLLGCLRPVWTILGKGSQKEGKFDSWTIPFEEIRELQWLGSGAQGAVFLGVFGGEQVAVKKVRHQKDTEIRHLRHLDHQNIIRFR